MTAMRLLAIRLHALGDVMITLPYLNDVKRRNPGLEIDLLTRDAYAAIPEGLDLFSQVHRVRGGRGFKELSVRTAARLPRLWQRRYELVVDLQNNEISRAVTAALRVPVGSRFDRLAPRPAGERTREALERAGLGPVALDTDLRLRDPDESELLRSLDLDVAPFVVLNPAGAFPSRHWPIGSYARFADAYEALRDGPVRFVVMGVASLASRIAPLREALGERLIDLVGRTSQLDAFAIARRAELVLSEDSGLMHLAWISGVPTLALFGSSRGDWSRPLGPLSMCLDSGDLECGYCMEETCRFGDNRCLTRYEPETVATLARELTRHQRRRRLQTSEAVLA